MCVYTCEQVGPEDMVLLTNASNNNNKSFDYVYQLIVLMAGAATFKEKEH